MPIMELQNLHQEDFTCIGGEESRLFCTKQSVRLTKRDLSQTFRLGKVDLISVAEIQETIYTLHNLLHQEDFTPPRVLDFRRVTSALWLRGFFPAF